MAPGGVRTRECSPYFHEGLSTPSWEWLHPRNGGGVVLRLATRGCCWRVYDSHSGLKALGLLCAGNRVFFFFFLPRKAGPLYVVVLCSLLQTCCQAVWRHVY